MERVGAHTLVESEARWRVATLATALCSGAVELGALAYAWARLPWLWWTGCALASVALNFSNLHYLAAHRGNPTVGMIPVAVASLAPATFAAACVPPAWPAARWALVGVCLAATLGTLWVVRWLCALRRACAATRPVRDGAAVIVLGAAVRAGAPSRTLAARLEAACSIWREHRDVTLVVTGGPTPDGSTTEASVMAAYLRERGVPCDDLVIEPRARNTEQNIAYANALLDARGFAGQRCVASSDFHIYRALTIGRRLGLELVAVPVRTSATSRLQQWCREALTVALTLRA